MKLNPASAGKLASISALGAGALMVSMGQAEAGVIYEAISPNGKVGFTTPGFNASFTKTNPAFSSVGFGFYRSSGSARQGSGSGGNGRRSVKFSGLNGAKFATHSGMLRLFAAGATLGALGVNAGGTVAFRSWWTTQTHHLTGSGDSTTSTTSTFQHHSASPGGFSNEYALFTFIFNAQTYYGWVELSLTNQDVYGAANGTGPDLTVLGWAFENAPLRAGDTTGVPEPGTLATTGLAALALGAVGVRRWRATRTNRAA